jgi:mannose-6-phosphate isomerase-like protein (cupin superfamily)
MNPVYFFNPHSEFSTNERCDITELLNQAVDATCSIAKARVAPGVTTQLHSVQNTTERYVIMQGQGEVMIDNNDPLPVAYLDTVLIPPGAAQQITNTGDEDLLFLCICTPRFRQKNYRCLENSCLENKDEK